MSLPSIKVKLLDENETKDEIIKELDATTGNSADKIEPLEEINLEDMISNKNNPNPNPELESMEEINLEADMNPNPKTELEPQDEISVETINVNETKPKLDNQEVIKMEDLHVNDPKPEFDPMEEIRLETMTVVPSENNSYEDNLLEEVELNNIIEPVDDINDLLGVEINKDEINDEVLSFGHKEDNETTEENVGGDDTNTDFIYLLDSNIDNSKNIQSGGGISGIKGNYFEDDNYIEYLENYGMFLKEKNQKGNQSKFSYEEKDGILIKTSLKTGNKTTIIVPEYKRVEDILNYIDIEINKIVYKLKKKRDDILGNNIYKESFDKLKTKYLDLLKYKKGCIKFINYSESKIIDNEIILLKKIKMKDKLFNITKKLKHINSTTKNKEETNKIIKEYIEENQILSLEKKIRENNNSNMFWNDVDNNNIDLKYDKLLIKEPRVKKDSSGTQDSTYKKPKKLKLKLKKAKEKEVEKDKEDVEKEKEYSELQAELQAELKEKGSEYRKVRKDFGKDDPLRLKQAKTKKQNAERDKKLKESYKNLFSSDEEEEEEQKEKPKKLKLKKAKVEVDEVGVEKKDGDKKDKPKKLKLKLKYSPQINASDPSYGDAGWDGPFKEAELQSGKASIIKTPGLKIKTVEEAKETCNNTEECQGITEDTSRKNKKITLRKTDIFKSSDNRRSWVKK